VSVGALQFPSSPMQEPNHHQPPRSPWSPSSFCSQPEVEDEYLSPEMRLHIAFEVVSQLDKAKNFRWLPLEELSFRDFLVEQIRSLQLVVEAQDDAPPSSQVSIASAQVPLPPQREVVDEGLTLEDEYLSSEVRLHIAFEMFSQLGNAEVSRWLSPEEVSLRDFLVEQIRSLQLVVEEQGVAPSLSQASVASTQDTLPSQPAVPSVGRCSGIVAQISLAPSVRDGGQVSI
jgi:hypothetical protein